MSKLDRNHILKLIREYARSRNFYWLANTIAAESGSSVDQRMAEAARQVMLKKRQHIIRILTPGGLA